MYVYYIYIHTDNRVLGIKRHYNGQQHFRGLLAKMCHAWIVPAREWLVEEDKVPESSKAALKVNSFVTKDGFILLCCLSPPVTFAGPCWPMLLNPLCILCHPLRTRSPQEFQSSTAKEAPAKELSHQSAASTGTTKDCLRLLLEKQCRRLPFNAKVWSNALLFCMQQFVFEYFEKDTPLMSEEVRQSSNSWQFWCWTVDRNDLSHPYPFADISRDVGSQDSSSKKQKTSSEAAKVQAKQDMWWDVVGCHDILI